MTRRSVVPILAAGAFAARRSTGATALRYLNLDHVSVQVADVTKSLAWYAGVFGATTRKENDSPRYYVKLGSAYMALSTSRAAFRIDHFCSGLQGVSVDEARQYLKDQGIAFTEPPPFGLFFADPEGIRVQLWSEYSWTDVGKTTSPVPSDDGGSPIFKPIGLDHLILAVADLDKASGYYEKLFGSVSSREKDRVWFKVGTSRVGLKPLDGGQKPEIERFCVSVAPFDAAAVKTQLQNRGAKLDGGEAGSVFGFSDPDGIRVQVVVNK